jgi:hypothetical protein
LDIYEDKLAEVMLVLGHPISLRCLCASIAPLTHIQAAAVHVEEIRIKAQKKTGKPWHPTENFLEPLVLEPPSS